MHTRTGMVTVKKGADMAKKRYLIGCDFGTDSVRAVVVSANGGEEASCAVPYPRWSRGLYCDPRENRFRQHPLDYTESMINAVRGALADLPADAAQRVVGIGIDTTGSTPCAVNEAGTPLALLPEFADNPNAMFVLWKDHTAVDEAAEINRAAASWSGPDFTAYEGGIYSSEWFWAKILHILRCDEAVRQAAFSWVEHCDWMPALLTGNTDPLTLKRSRCAAGHKAMWHAAWGGLPGEEFLADLDPLLAGLRERLYTETFTADVPAGRLCPEWAEKLGLPSGIAVSVGAFDAHMGAVGGGIKPATLTKIMGTSTCDMLVAAPGIIGDKQVAGICGQVDGSIIPGMIGLEAGQSSFGDVYAWFVDILFWPLRFVQPSGASEEEELELKQGIKDTILENLTRAAEALDMENTSLLALDWLNGRRTPDADQSLKGALIGLTLGTSAPMIFRALVEATAFGSRAIVERFRREGVAIDEVVALGGIAQKSGFVMQVSADVLNMPIKVARSQETCALGAAMFAAAAAGVHPTLPQAQERMAGGFAETYRPDPERAARYDNLYRRYLELGDCLADQLRTL
jgi:L-ribulokinase